MQGLVLSRGGEKVETAGEAGDDPISTRARTGRAMKIAARMAKTPTR